MEARTTFGGAGFSNAMNPPSARVERASTARAARSGQSRGGGAAATAGTMGPAERGASSPVVPARTSSTTIRASEALCSRLFGLRERQRRRRRRISGGVASGSAVKSISRVSTAASVSGTVSAAKTIRRVSIS